ncbi:MAG TPA: ATP-binding cassette domain-containing protein [Actinomycetota bacterium]|nr:ATP-binding cassette domain-containing protein [Actinomycetota bacterium]
MSDPAISVDGLVKRFGDVTALDGISLSVEPRTVFGLLGPNGAGKTTAVRILTTIIAPDSGTASVLGHDVVKDADQVRRVIGLAGQYAAVDDLLSGRENLMMIGKLTHIPKDMILPRAAELLERFGLIEAADRPVRTYSGGMRRRLDLAAALVHRPPVLFLDEPTTGLDPLGRSQMWDMIRELVNDGTTVLLTTQYLEEADRLADRLVVIDRGHVIAEGTPAQLKSQLGDTVVEMGFADEATAMRVLDILAIYKPEREGALIRLSSAEGPKVLVDVLRRLDDKNLVPTTLALREPSLDDVFLTLTGKHAEPVEEQIDEPAGDGARGRKLARSGDQR